LGRSIDCSHRTATGAVADVPLVNATGCEDSTGQRNRSNGRAAGAGPLPSVDGKIRTLVRGNIPTVINGNMSPVPGAADRESSLPASAAATAHQRAVDRRRGRHRRCPDDLGYLGASCSGPCAGFGRARRRPRERHARRRRAEILATRIRRATPRRHAQYRRTTPNSRSRSIGFIKVATAPNAWARSSASIAPDITATGTLATVGSPN